MSKRTLFLIVPALVLLALLASSSIFAQGPAGSSPEDMASRAFTYQGYLRNGAGTPVSSTCDFSFGAWDMLSGGTQVGSACNVSGVAVSNGYFTVQINGGGEFTAFRGDARWLEVAVKCTGDAGYTTLAPRQELTATPYALSLRPGAQIEGAGELFVSNTSIGGTSMSPNRGVYGFSKDTTGVGYGVAGGSWSPGGAGVYGESSSDTGTGVYGLATAGSGTTYGVYGLSDSDAGIGVYGEGANGVVGKSSSPGYAAVFGQNDVSGYGVYGQAAATDGTGVYGGAPGGGIGVHGLAGTSNVAIGVLGESDATGASYVIGVKGRINGPNGIAVYGVVENAQVGEDAVAIRGDAPAGAMSGLFDGDVLVMGTLSKGGGSFKIDDPLDPAHKYLYHSFVESPDMMNIYNGNVTLDGAGKAWVQLPDWFETLNQDFRYQLTCIGGFAPVYIAQKIQGNRFQIAGGTPGLEVSWMVTGIRHDPWAEAYRIPVEQVKPAHEQGTYLYPELYGQPKSAGLYYLGPAAPAAVPGPASAPAARPR